MTVQLSLESAFQVCEVQETVPYDDVVDDLHAILLCRWWYPQGQQRRSQIEQSKSRYVYVLGDFQLSQSELSIFTPRV